MKRVARLGASVASPVLLAALLGTGVAQEAQGPSSGSPQEQVAILPETAGDQFPGYIAVAQARWDAWQEREHSLLPGIDNVQNPCAPLIGTDITTLENSAKGFFLALDNYRSRWASWIQEQVRVASVELPVSTDPEDYKRLAASLQADIDRESQQRTDATTMPPGPERDLLISEVEDNIQLLHARLANTKKEGEDAGTVAARREAVRKTLDERKARVLSRVQADAEWKSAVILTYEALRSRKQLECVQGNQPHLPQTRVQKK